MSNFIKDFITGGKELAVAKKRIRELKTEAAEKKLGRRHQTELSQLRSRERAHVLKLLGTFFLLSGGGVAATVAALSQQCNSAQPDASQELK